jgi:hypothetical protein
VVLSGPTSLTTVADDASITYDSGGFVGTSVQRFEITSPGLYELRWRPTTCEWSPQWDATPTRV